MRSIFFLFLIVFVLKSSAQREPLSSMFWGNYSVVNPANSGLEFDHYYGAQSRITNGEESGNSNANVEAIWAIAELNTGLLHGGIGVNYRRNVFGRFTGDRFNFNYNYRFNFNETHKLAIGFAIGVDYWQQKLDDDFWIAFDNPSSDPAIPKELNQTTYTGALGLTYLFRNLKIGVSVINLNEAIIENGLPYFNSEIPNYREFYLLSSYKIELGKKIIINPQMLIRDGILGWYGDLNCRIFYAEMFWIGGTIRSDMTIAGMLGIQFWKRLNLSYAYELDEGFESGPFNDLNNIHEFQLSFSVQK